MADETSMLSIIEDENSPLSFGRSGRDHAFGAMFVGHGAVEGVKAAIAHDTGCGGPIVVLRHRK